MTKEQKSVIFGSLLGDGYLQKQKNCNGILRIERRYKDKDYLLWQYNILKDLCKSEPTSRVRKRWGKNLKSIRFHTKALPYLSNVHKIFYKNNIKIVNQRILAQLDELALAVWYMDDGCTFITKHKGGAYKTLYLCCQGFTDKERKIIIDYFKRKWDIDGWRTDKSGNIMIGGGKGQKFLEIIRPFIVPCMERKIKEY